MVFKVSKGGVRSGNTLRGLQSRRTKLYGRHACLIGSSSLGQRNLNSLLRKSPEEDNLVGDTLKRTDVLLSLNKKQRWRVPGMVNQMISSGNFNKSVMISLLERHKLKRRANCIRFTSNEDRFPNVEPKQKKYFSFSLDSIGREQSNRERKRIRAEELKHDRATSKNPILENRFIKTINTYTIEGGKFFNNHQPLESLKEEYRLEVFYPCPQSCSLTFNPKYTNVFLDKGKSGKLEVKSNVKAPRNRQKHHRHRFTIRDFDEVDNETVEDDVNEMWNNCQDSDSEETSLHEYENKIQMHQSPVNYFEMLINKAENAQKLLIRQRRPHKAKKVDKPNWENDKSHIVYIDHKKGEYSTNASSIQDFDSNTYLKEIEPLDSIKVILESNETSEEFLEQKYGSMYSEANCYPRRFMINITDDVANLLSSTKHLSKDVLFMSYLVFIHDGIYDEGLEVFRVVFNSYSCKNAHNLSQYISFSLMTFDEIMKGIIGYLLDLKEKKELRYNHNLHVSKNINGMYSFLYNCINLNVKSFKPSNALSEKSCFESLDEENMKLKKELSRLTTSFDEDVFCDICYDVINATKIDAVYGTKLAKCGHHCCDCCWASHFQSRMRNGLTTMTCPGYNCSSEIGLVTLLSLIDVSDVALLFQRRAEKQVEEAENTKWCPNPDCEHVIKVDSSSKDFCQDVVCACGTEICFACFGSAHWPAKCVQAEDYLEKLTTIKPPKENVDEPENMHNINTQQLNQKKLKSYEIEGRICPKCNRFIDKNGGCPNMICKCGFAFCWRCMKASHVSPLCSKINVNYLFKQTRIIRIHHISRNKISTMTPEHKNSKIDNAKQKASLYHHALQQRIEASTSKSCYTSEKSLIFRIVSRAQKDLHFKKEIITTIELQAIPENEDQLMRMNIKPSVDQLIKSSQDIKRVLHHVAEFSYVLLQDTQHSVEKQRILRLANDISGICSFFSSIIDLGDNQDAKTAFHRLISIQEWAKRALDALIAATRRLRQQ